ncbi:transcription-repair coupling factor [Numidum massiliense]|uniref:transcription-repair coupling factor n=1 Tax=Numidum massiliense TaxID=1522315 RepID=UPI0006D57364|nr:transcription-repair coupling factor [Numidum massiliense]
MDALITRFAEDKDVQSTVQGVANGLSEQLVAGLGGSARALYAAAVYRELRRPIVFITHNLNQAQRLVEDLLEFLSEDDVLLYPANELIAAEMAMSEQANGGERIGVLSALSRGFRGILVVPYVGLRKKFIPARVFRDAHVTLAEAEIVTIDDLSARLVATGYERVDKVEHGGEFSVRGGIVDVFPPSFARPLRIEWFDDEIDTIREFDVDSQRSQERRERVTLPPARELFATADTLYQGSEQLQKRLDERLRRVKDPKLQEELLEAIGAEIERMKQGVADRELYKYMSLLYEDSANLTTYMPQDTVLLFDDPARIQETAKQLEHEEAEWETTLLKQGKLLPDLEMSLRYEQLLTELKQPKIHLTMFVRQVPNTNPQNIVNVLTRAMQQFHGQMHVLKTEWDRWQKTNHRVVFLASNRERAERLARVLGDYKMDVDILEHRIHTVPPRPSVLIGHLHNGFELPSIRLVVVTEGEVFTQKQRRARRVAKMSNTERIKHYQDLKPGDYVVHVNHGIGKYLGIETLQVAGLHKDYLNVRYAGNDTLYVPVEQIDLIQKYVGSEEKTPKVYSLGGSEWSKVKNKVKSSVEDIANDLIKLYAKRQATKGHQFPAEVPYVREFEALFAYEETPDQQRAIDEVYKDMESAVPMDRLVCGDVGYGKTEVAIRAAFKAVMDGKQTAVLVPTTILAQQHYETFRERFADFPINIQVLSRFRTRKEQRETIKGLKNGTVDIVIGTHRLLSKDVEFRDLGLLVVDEEQRFGVKHKEKIKKLRHNVDAMTLTATPIPRTLHMSMLGVRDLSLIETPPENRFPVQTYVVEYSPTLVREAIERELARGGQVYFLYNRVSNIQTMADQISALVPDARIAVAHGQMSELELERVMLDFLDGEYDVLVSTSIIETGVDIPNVNTLIIYNADAMGLSQLYQLRGRVGRSSRIAYAYFTYQHGKVLSEEAEKRLGAIREFTELGSGFKIAMRDLSIRGAGNLLGAEQHGHIASVGFDLYSQMLKDAIEDLKGEAPQEKVDPDVELKIDAYIPQDYIADERQKVEFYKRVRGIDTLDDVKEIEEEMVDRFGEPPQPVHHLLYLSRLKMYAKACDITVIKQKGEQVNMKFQATNIEGRKLIKLAQLYKNRIRLIPGKDIRCEFKLKGLKAEERLAMLERFLIQCESLANAKGEVQHAAN